MPFEYVLSRYLIIRGDYMDSVRRDKSIQMHLEQYTRDIRSLLDDCGWEPAKFFAELKRHEVE